MTIAQFVKAQKPQGINQWIALIEKSNLSQHQNIILDCAESLSLVTINESASFHSAINF